MGRETEVGVVHSGELSVQQHDFAMKALDALDFTNLEMLGSPPIKQEAGMGPSSSGEQPLPLAAPAAAPLKLAAPAAAPLGSAVPAASASPAASTQVVALPQKCMSKVKQASAALNGLKVRLMQQLATGTATAAAADFRARNLQGKVQFLQDTLQVYELFQVEGRWMPSGAPALPEEVARRLQEDHQRVAELHGNLSAFVAMNKSKR